MIQKLQALGAILLMALLSVLAAFRKGYGKGVEEAKNEAKTETLNSVAKAKEVRDEEARVSDDDVINRLRDKWTRD